jgi:hypothetical protein
LPPKKRKGAEKRWLGLFLKPGLRLEQKAG